MRRTKMRHHLLPGPRSGGIELGKQKAPSHWRVRQYGTRWTAVLTNEGFLERPGLRTARVLSTQTVHRGKSTWLAWSVREGTSLPSAGAMDVGLRYCQASGLALSKRTCLGEYGGIRCGCRVRGGVDPDLADWGGGMDKAVVGLADAIEALRGELMTAAAAGEDQVMRFSIEPVELTVQVAVTKDANGKIGWAIFEAGAGYENVTTDADSAPGAAVVAGGRDLDLGLRDLRPGVPR